ncbi:MAG: GTPase domain-containing protein [Planctomycetes bacterium]|nr:GTPase domain-containing protein [Planctomycetota bacterium]
MVQINFALREVNCKVVYYGPGLSGKTTNLEVIHAKAPASSTGELTSIATEGDRTLFFDFLPLNLGKVAGMTTRFQIYTVPGQVYYNSTRKLVLQGADGIVFVADSRREKLEENIESLRNLRENLREYGMDLRKIPFVFQYNKRDMQDLSTVEELQEKLNPEGVPYFEAVAKTGAGVFPTLKKLSAMVLEGLNKQSRAAASRREGRPAAVAVGAGAAGSAGGAAQPPGGTAQGVRASAGSPPPGSAPSQAAPRPARPAPSARVVREDVTSAQGIRPIERHRPVPAEGVCRKPGGRGIPWVWIVAGIAAVGALAGAYFAGLLG